MDFASMIPQMRGRQAAQANPDAPVPDTSEQIYISSLALIKMLKHGIVFLRLNNLSHLFVFFFKSKVDLEFLLRSWD